MRKSFFLLLFLTLTTAISAGEHIPPAPDYRDTLMWYVQPGDTTGAGADVFYVVSTWERDWVTEAADSCRYADVYNERHRRHMTKEARKVAAYMSRGNNFYAPYYRRITMDSWATRNDSIINSRFVLAMSDVKRAFEAFLASRDSERPFILAGYSQGAKAVIELLKSLNDDTFDRMVAAYVLGYKVTPDDTARCKNIRAARKADDIGVTICYNTVKDPKYASTAISIPCAMCINPVNWRTDETPAVLHDTITVAVDTALHVLVVKGYSGSEYKPILGFLNVGDIHSCEPWLYSECLKENFVTRTRAWRKAHAGAKK